MAKGKSGGFSFRSDDAVEQGLFSSGPARIVEAIGAMFKYGNTTAQPVILVTFERDGEKYEQPYSVGKGWKVKDDALIPVAGQTGLGKSCNAMLYLIKPLEKAIEAADGDLDAVMDGFPGSLVDMEVVVTRVPQQKREGLPERKGAAAADANKERTILEIEEITAFPGDGKKAKSGGKASTKAKPAAYDDEDDEAPARGKGKTNGKAKDDDDEADTDGDDALKEEAVEAVIAALEGERSGSLSFDDLPDALAAVLKGNKQAKAIINYISRDEYDFLGVEKGWTVDTKKQLVSLDE